jgi:hypothetical protein
MNWFQSTNAKEIGTLYLIFAVCGCMALGILNLLVLLEPSDSFQILQEGTKIFLFLSWFVSGCYVYTLLVYWSGIFRGFTVLSYIFTLLLNRGQKINFIIISIFKKITWTQLLRYFYSSFFVLIISFAVLNMV